MSLSSMAGSPVVMPEGRLSDEGIGWIAAHGGAGTTTLTELIGGVDLGCRWPDPALGEPARVVLVARSNRSGMRAASRALNALREGRHPGGMRLMCVALVADAPGRLPMPLSRQIRVLRSVTPVRRVPWMPACRLGNRPRQLPAELTKLAAELGVRR